MFAVGILKLAGDIRFELMMTISKTVALGQTRRIPNILKHTNENRTPQGLTLGYN